MSGHTPGPWAVGYWGGQCFDKHQHGDGKCNYVPQFQSSLTAISQAREDGELIVSVDEPLNEADARLIAAAPELLQAARIVLDDLDKHSEGLPRFRDMLRAAIAKAEGK